MVSNPNRLPGDLEILLGFSRQFFFLSFIMGISYLLLHPKIKSITLFLTLQINIVIITWVSQSSATHLQPCNSHSLCHDGWSSPSLFKAVLDPIPSRVPRLFSFSLTCLPLDPCCQYFNAMKSPLYNKTNQIPSTLLCLHLLTPHSVLNSL